ATPNVRVAAQEAQVRRVVYAGSTAAYGDAAELPTHELLLPRPLSTYAAAKLAGEAYCQAFFRTHGLETVVLRYFNVFGPRQNLESRYGAVVPLFIAAALRGEAPVIFGDGSQTRDVTFVTNVVDANRLASPAPARLGIAVQTHNHTGLLLAQLLEHLRGKRILAGPQRLEPGRAFIEERPRLRVLQHIGEVDDRALEVSRQSPRQSPAIARSDGTRIRSDGGIAGRLGTLGEPIETGPPTHLVPRPGPEAHRRARESGAIDSGERRRVI